ncbi:hypothetical protein E4T42_00079 [Aureobasidium subglaciale]|nr:hypothetical protein E4T42_00079 [Aureobasidium subglaciale]
MDHETHRSLMHITHPFLATTANTGIDTNHLGSCKGTCADRPSYSGYLPLIIYLGYTRSVPRPSLIKYDSAFDPRLFSPLAI